MRDLDRMIDEALGREESELLRNISGEPGFFERALDLFGAGVGWMVGFMIFGQSVLLIGGAWAAWMFFESTDPVTQLRWGLPSAVLLLGSLAIKLSVGPPIYTNRIMRELKRLELQIARGKRD